MKVRERFARDDVHAYLHDVFGNDVHAKRVLSLANTTTGMLTSQQTCGRTSRCGCRTWWPSGAR